MAKIVIINDTRHLSNASAISYVAEAVEYLEVYGAYEVDDYIVQKRKTHYLVSED